MTQTHIMCCCVGLSRGKKWKRKRLLMKPENSSVDPGHFLFIKSYLYFRPSGPTSSDTSSFCLAEPTI